jgi:ATP-dependent Clp protease ATP-binding subunit ClpA
MNPFEWFRKGLKMPMPHPDYTEALNCFTPRAQRLLALARKEADRFNHNFVGTEHLLLGLISLGQGTAVNVLGSMGLDLETVRMEVEKQVGSGPDQKGIGNIPYTPRVKKVLALAAKEAKEPNHTYVGTEHILLGLLREGDGVAARVLKNLDVVIEVTRQHILRELEPKFSANVDKSALGFGAGPPPQPTDMIDTTKRYDVYCEERNQEVVYHNVLFKVVKRLLQKDRHTPYEIFYEFVEIEQANGETLYIVRASIKKFCEHKDTPSDAPKSPGV